MVVPPSALPFSFSYVDFARPSVVAGHNPNTKCSGYRGSATTCSRRSPTIRTVAEQFTFKPEPLRFDDTLRAPVIESYQDSPRSTKAALGGMSPGASFFSPLRRSNGAFRVFLALVRVRINGHASRRRNSRQVHLIKFAPRLPLRARVPCRLRHSRIAPSVIPCMKVRCSKTKTTNGTVMIIAKPAKSII